MEPDIRFEGGKWPQRPVPPRATPRRCVWSKKTSFSDDYYNFVVTVELTTSDDVVVSHCKSCAATSGKTETPQNRKRLNWMATRSVVSRNRFTGSNIIRLLTLKTASLRFNWNFQSWPGRAKTKHFKQSNPIDYLMNLKFIGFVDLVYELYFSSSSVMAGLLI